MAEQDAPGGSEPSPPQAPTPARWHAPKEAFGPPAARYGGLPLDQFDGGTVMAGADRRDTPLPLRQAARVAQEAAGAFNTPTQIAALQRRNGAAVFEAKTPTAPYPGAPTLIQNHVLTAADSKSSTQTVGTTDLKLQTVPPSVEIAQAPRRTARTAVGAAVLADGASIVIALAGLQIQIEAKLASLKERRFDSDEKHEEIADCEDIKERVEANLDVTVRFLAGEAEEEALVKGATSFAATLRDIWEKRNLQFADLGLLISSVGVCHLMGADTNLATVVCGALVGRTAVVDALKAVFGKGE
jgi:hypothetical protein